MSDLAEALRAYLASRNGKLPEVEDRYMPDRLGEYSPFNYKITLSNRLRGQQREAALLHELVHATDQTHTSQYTNLPVFPNDDERRFSDAYEKLNYDVKQRQTPYVSLPRLKSIEAILGRDRLSEGLDYRYNSAEVPAHGVANSLFPSQAVNPAPLHVDPTAATEFAVLQELAQRAHNSRNQKPK